MKISLLLCV